MSPGHGKSAQGKKEGRKGELVRWRYQDQVRNLRLWKKKKKRRRGRRRPRKGHSPLALNSALTTRLHSALCRQAGRQAEALGQQGHYGKGRRRRSRRVARLDRSRPMDTTRYRTGRPIGIPRQALRTRLSQVALLLFTEPRQEPLLEQPSQPHSG